MYFDSQPERLFIGECKDGCIVKGVFYGTKRDKKTQKICEITKFNLEQLSFHKTAPVKDRLVYLVAQGTLHNPRAQYPHVYERAYAYTQHRPSLPQTGQRLFEGKLYKGHFIKYERLCGSAEWQRRRARNVDFNVIFEHFHDERRGVPGSIEKIKEYCVKSLSSFTFEKELEMVHGTIRKYEPEKHKYDFNVKCEFDEFNILQGMLEMDCKRWYASDKSFSGSIRALYAYKHRKEDNTYKHRKCSVCALTPQNRPHKKCPQ